MPFGNKAVSYPPDMQFEKARYTNEYQNEDNAIIRPSYLHNSISNTSKIPIPSWWKDISILLAYELPIPSFSIKALSLYGYYSGYMLLS